MRKPKPGVCGRCGHAVMRALREPVNGTINGHEYKDGQLVRARCRDHGGLHFVARPDSDLIIDGFIGHMPMPVIFRGDE